MIELASALVAAIALAVGLLSVAKTRDWLNPVFLLSLLIAAVYCGKALVIAGEKRLILSYNYATTYADSDVVLALAFVLASFLIVATLFLPGAKGVRQTCVETKLGVPARSYNFALIVGMAISGASVVYAFRDIPTYAVAQVLANRFELYQDQGYLLPLMGAYRAAAFLWMIANCRRARWWTIAAVYAPTLMFDLLTGSRGKLVIENMLVATLILARCDRIKLTGARIFVGLATALVLTVGLKLALRDAALTSNAERGIASVVLNDFEDELKSIYVGPEVAVLDSTVFVIHNAMGTLGGSSLLAPLFYPIPRAIFSDKPRGASSVLTERFFPHYYFPDRVEFAFPLLAEFLANFGAAGLFAFALVAVLIRYSYGLSFSPNAMVQLIGIVLLSRSVLLFRNDLLNFSIGVANILVLILVMNAVAAVANIRLFGRDSQRRRQPRFG